MKGVVHRRGGPVNERGCMSIVRAFQCDWCEELDADQYAGNEVGTRNGSEVYCDDCTESYTWSCEDCEQTFNETVEHYDYRCEECHEAREDMTVKRHDYKPDSWTMHGEGVAFYGIELEMEARKYELMRLSLWPRLWLRMLSL